MTVRPHAPRVAALVTCALLLAACGNGDAAPAEDRIQMTPMARGIVDIDGGVIRVPAQRSGVVREISVHEGDHVEAGALLAALDDREAVLRRDAAKAGLDARRAQAAAAATKADTAKAMVDKLRRLIAANAAMPQELGDALAASAAAEAERAQANAAAAGADADLRLAQLDLDSHRIFAPVAGAILKLSIAAGGFATPQDAEPAFILAPDLPRIVRAELDETFASNVQVGMSAQIIDDGAPDSPAVTAHVTRIAQSFEAASLTAASDPRPDTRILRVTLDMPADPRFRLGQKVTVRFGP